MPAQPLPVARRPDRRTAEWLLGEAEEASFRLLVIHWGLTLLFGGYCVLFALATRGPGSGELIGGLVDGFLSLLLVAYLALLALSLIVSAVAFWLYTQIARRRNYGACITLSGALMMVFPHGSWYGYKMRKALTHPGVGSLFPS